MIQKLSPEEICMKLKPIFGKKIDDIYLRYAMADREEKEEILQVLNTLYNKNLSQLLDNKILLEPPSRLLMDGEYPLSMISYADKQLYPFALREKDWIRHVCISGMSGSGKTTLAFHIINNFIKHEKPFLIFDWKKSFRPLMLIDNEIMCFTVGKDSVSNLFKVNLNKPPKDVSPKEWISVLCDLLAESFFVSFGVHKILVETLDDAFKEWGVYNGSENYPTWNNIKWYLEERSHKAKGREATWYESALRIASVLTFGDFGKVCNYKGEDSFSIEELLNKKVIFELNSLGSVEKKFFCEFLLTYIYKLKKASQSNSNGNFENAIIVDEAHNIFLKGETHFTKESVTDMIYREIREYGTSLVCLDQHISKLSDTVKGNSACHIAFQQQLPQDLWDIGELMQLKDRKNYFSMLPVGSAIVRLSERFNSPFLIEVPSVKLKDKDLNDEDIKSKMKFIFSARETLNKKDEFHNLVVGKIEQRFEKIDKNEVLDKALQENLEVEKEAIKGPFSKTQNKIYEAVLERLSEGKGLAEIEKEIEKERMHYGYSVNDILEVINYVFENQFRDIIAQRTEIVKPSEMNLQNKFLDYLKQNPEHNKSTVEIYKILGFSTRKGNIIKDELLEKNLIRIEEQKNKTGWKKIITLNN
ncbi:MAG: DUF87 domain-containing protein [Nanoarchaeota archaeon]|nr:DUF87 domain-containing protein [Nanoarchaeota archaeon]